MSRPCVTCGDHHQAGERINAFDHELPAGDLAAIQQALLAPSDPGSLERAAAEWGALVAAERAAT